MKMTSQIQAVRSNIHLGASPAKFGASGAAGQIVDNRPEAAVQRRLSAAVASSPYIATQRKQLSSGFRGPVQRKGPEEKVPAQGKFAIAQRVSPKKEKPAQGKGLKKEELPAQGKFAPAQRVEGAGVADNRSGLPPALRAGVESLSGVSMDGVKVHRNSPNPARINALAYAQGSDIHLGPGQEKHLPHEAWHVVQQAEGRVRPTLQAQGMPINDDKGLEREADTLGARAAQTKTAPVEDRKSRQ
jgi:hypothetical protein